MPECFSMPNSLLPLTSRTPLRALPFMFNDVVPEISKMGTIKATSSEATITYQSSKATCMSVSVC